MAMSCFEKAEEDRHTSIAFTTENMVILQFYPPDMVARVLFETIIKFAETNPVYLQKVVLVASPPAKALFKVDVIVNSTGNRLNLSEGPISKIILEAAGSSIQEECKNNYPNGIESWGVAVTSGGNITCKQIYHICLVRSEWSSVKQKYKDIINYLLETADSTGHTSIAFPVLGTGLIQYPNDQVAKSLFETAMAFQGNHLKTILFVVHPKDFANRKVNCSMYAVTDN
ncbi:protein mono-ADP-ribosyltransferase PARP14-like [Gigantopelta aegis]|uniref:protein mono-ADP-ribosyltransferase PARP14-like n=1 Tax=Gigantopelta aegis TaxID=1735272 RepID=UPI001B88D73C|nr:protein mono-ADP-ribosyltransferase PARP14-like [Gigantopelta aegis]